MAEKQKRTSAKGRFKRQETHPAELLDIQGDNVIVTPAYEKLLECWNWLEEAHEEFVDAENIEVETNDDSDKYIDELNVRYRNLV